MRVGVISVTINAVVPMMAAFRQQKDIHAVNYLDEGLYALVQREGKLSDDSMARMTGLIGQAIRDGAEALLLTCSVFTPATDRLQRIFSVPIVSADGAMLEQAAKYGKKTAILCTFPAAVDAASVAFQAAAERLNTAAEADVFLLENAARALQADDKGLHDQIIRNRVVELDKRYSVIVLAQISMSEAVSRLENISACVLTSPGSAIEALASLMD